MRRCLLAVALVIAGTSSAAAEPVGPELADYLGSRRGFQKVRKDVLGHVMVFLGWKDRDQRIAWVVDNQGSRHGRDLDGSVEHGVSAAVFGLRDAGK